MCLAASVLLVCVRAVRALECSRVATRQEGLREIKLTPNLLVRGLVEICACYAGPGLLAVAFVNLLSKKDLN